MYSLFCGFPERYNTIGKSYYFTKGRFAQMAASMQFPTTDEHVLTYGNTTIGVINDICLVSQFQVGPWQVLYRPMETGNVRRWGLPLMIPNFSWLKNGTFEEKGTQLPMHGFGRTLPWPITKEDTSHLTMQLHSSAATLPSYPYEFTFMAEVAVGEGTLTYTLTIENHSDEAMPIAPGFHPYFAVAQQEKARLVVSGLPDFNASAINWNTNPPDNAYPFPRRGYAHRRGDTGQWPVFTGKYAGLVGTGRQARSQFRLLRANGWQCRRPQPARRPAQYSPSRLPPAHFAVDGETSIIAGDGQRYSVGSIAAILVMTSSVAFSISSRVVLRPAGLKVIGSPKVSVTRGRIFLRMFSDPAMATGMTGAPLRRAIMPRPECPFASLCVLLRVPSGKIKSTSPFFKSSSAARMAWRSASPRLTGKPPMKRTSQLMLE